MLEVAGRDQDARIYDDVYDGVVMLDALGVNLPPETRVLEITAPYPRLSVDVLVEVLTPEGFICEGREKDVERVRSWWQRSRFDSGAKLALKETLIRGCSYLVAARMPGGWVRFQPVSSDCATVEFDHNGDVQEGIWVFRDRVGGHDGLLQAVYYTPGETLLMRKEYGGWRTVGRVSTGARVPAIVPLVNQTRVSNPRGVSEMDELITISNAASRSMTGLQIGQELMVMPVRALFGDGLEAVRSSTPEGRRKKLEIYFGSMLTGPKGSTLQQLPGADLTSLIKTVEMYARIICAQTGIPPSMLGIATDNPSSAEAMRAAKERLITRAETKQTLFGDAFEELARLGLAMVGSRVEGLELLECVWRDPATPSFSSKAENALRAQAQGVISAETARDYLSLTPEQKRREKANSGNVLDMMDILDKGFNDGWNTGTVTDTDTDTDADTVVGVGAGPVASGVGAAT